MRFVLLSPPEVGQEMRRVLLAADATCEIVAVSSREMLAAAAEGGGVLVSFGTGVVVPESILGRFRAGSFNIHAASPEFPGRDPHHFAAYRDAVEYGATAHRMLASVDSGPIVDVELHQVAPGSSPGELLQIANDCGLAIAARLLPRLVRREAIAPLPLTWGGIKTRRADFLRLARVEPWMTEVEFRRRMFAVEAPGHRNLHLDLFGERFRHEGRAPAKDNAAWSDFTEAAYAGLLDLAKSRYRFADFDSPGDGPHVLWRHDVDCSVHRALALATIEAGKGLVSTFFFHLSSAFYNLAERSVLDRARAILALGHRPGLHFDADFDATPGGFDGPKLEAAVARQRHLLEDLLGQDLRAVSLHNPEAVGLLGVKDPMLAGLANAYGEQFRDHLYRSDSNGVWRHGSIADALTAGAERLQILTHPAWWTPEPMPPRARIERCIVGRATVTMADYDSLLARNNRPNVAG